MHLSESLNSGTDCRIGKLEKRKKRCGSARCGLALHSNRGLCRPLLQMAFLCSPLSAGAAPSLTHSLHAERPFTSIILRSLSPKQKIGSITHTKKENKLGCTLILALCLQTYHISCFIKTVLFFCLLKAHTHTHAVVVFFSAVFISVGMLAYEFWLGCSLLVGGFL